MLMMRPDLRGLLRLLDLQLLQILLIGRA